MPTCLRFVRFWGQSGHKCRFVRFLTQTDGSRPFGNVLLKQSDDPLLLCFRFA
jgi:hypothetical protein